MTKDKKRKISFNSLKKLYKYIYPYKTTFYIGIVFLLLTSISSLYLAELIGELVKVASESQEKIKKPSILLGLLIGLFSVQTLLFYFYWNPLVELFRGINL